MKPLDLSRSCGLLALGASLLLSACNADKVWEPTDTPAASCSDMGAKPDADLTMPTKKALCKAAEGLAGGDDPATAVVCVDFASTTIDVLKQQQSWIFDDQPGCRWSIQGGRLVNTDLVTLTGGCQVKLPQKLLTAQQSRVTIAIMQRGEIGSSVQAGVYVTSTTRRPLISFVETLNNRIVLDVDRTDSRISNSQLLPIIYIEKVGTSAPSGPGWQIESIAVIANP